MRQLRLSAVEWERSRLPGELAAAWDQPNALFEVVRAGLELGARDAVLPACDRLSVLEGATQRVALVKSLALERSGRLTDAREVLERQRALDGDRPLTLTALSKLAARGRHAAEARALADRAVASPNAPLSSFEWWAALRSEGLSRDEVLGLLAARPGWPSTLLAGFEWLREGREFEARPLLAQALEASSFDPDAVRALAERTSEATWVPLVAGHYDAQRHGVELGPRLVAGLARLGRTGEARAVLAQLEALDAAVDFDALGALLLAGARSRPEAKSLRGASVAAPLWAATLPAGHSVFPSRVDGPVVALFQTSDARTSPADLGALSRALPLALAEQLRFRSTARVLTVFPVYPQGFARFEDAWPVDAALRFCPTPAPAVLVTSVLTESPLVARELELAFHLHGATGAERKFTVRSADGETDLFARAAQKLQVELARFGVAEAQPPVGLIATPATLDVDSLGALDDLLAFVLVERDVLERSAIASTKSGLQRLLDVACARTDLAAALMALAALSTKVSKPDEVRAYRAAVATVLLRRGLSRLAPRD